MQSKLPKDKNFYQYTCIAASSHCKWLDDSCLKIGINHHKIRLRTLRHNGIEDLEVKVKKYLERSDKIPMAVLDIKLLLKKEMNYLFLWL